MYTKLCEYITVKEDKHYKLRGIIALVIAGILLALVLRWREPKLILSAITAGVLGARKLRTPDRINRINDHILTEVDNAGREMLCSDFADTDAYLEDRLRIGEKAVFISEGSFICFSDITYVEIETYRPNRRSKEMTWMYAIKEDGNKAFICENYTNEMEAYWDAYSMIKEIITDKSSREDGRIDALSAFKLP